MLTKAKEKTRLPKVLIIDDDPNMIAILGSILGNEFKRQVTTSGKKALKILENTDDLPDVILLDLIMKGIDGYEICSIIRSNKKLKDIPIIVISGLTDGNSIKRAIDVGCTDYIRKPFGKKEVQARVLKHIEDYHNKKGLERSNLELSKRLKIQSIENSDFQMATIFALAKLTESRDDDTGAHLERVKGFCKLILEKLMLTEEYKNIINKDYIDLVEKASILHDIGKVAIEDRVLLKPGKLTELEFQRMKMHTTIGSDTLKEVSKEYPGNKFIEIGIEIARHHHESWDGRGYPDKLSGGQIPLSARVVAIADMYDALRSKRIYKDAYSHEKTLEIIKEVGGKDLDPFIVEVFLKYNEEFDKMYTSITEDNI